MIFHVTIDGTTADLTKGTWYLAMVGVGISKVSNTSVAKSSLPRLAVANEVYQSLVVPACQPGFFGGGGATGLLSQKIALSGTVAPA
jgi:hypothetical protein